MFLLEPPARFRNERLEGKLNTLDRARMNTIAIPTLDICRSAILHGWGGSGLARLREEGGLGIDLLVRAPILKRGEGGPPFNEGKTVRFEDEEEEGYGKGMFEEGGARFERKLDPSSSHVGVENGNGNWRGSIIIDNCRVNLSLHSCRNPAILLLYMYIYVSVI